MHVLLIRVHRNWKLAKSLIGNDLAPTEDRSRQRPGLLSQNPSAICCLPAELRLNISQTEEITRAQETGIICPNNNSIISPIYQSPHTCSEQEQVPVSIVTETLAHFIFQLLRFIVTFLSLSIHFLKAHWVPATQLGHQLCRVQGFGDSGEFIFSFLLLWWILLSFYKLSRRIIRGYCCVTLQHSDYHQRRQQRNIR